MSLAANETNKNEALPLVPALEEAPRPKSGLLTVYSDFASAERVWRRFEANADCYAFQSFDFLETWYRHIGVEANMDVQIVVVWGASARPMMILPLGIQKTGSLRRLTWLGNDVNDYNAPLLAPNFSDLVAPGGFAKLWGDIRSRLPGHDLIELMRQPAVVGEQANPFLELNVSLNASGAHMTTLTGDFDTYYDEKRKSKAKKQFRSHARKLAEIGETVYVHPETPADIAASVERLATLKSESLNAMGARNYLSEAGYIGFYKDLAVTSGAKGLAHVSHLEVGGEYVAGNWGLVHKGRFYYLLASYNGPRFGRYSPGIFALVETMRWASEQGVKTFDFTIGDEAYKKEWCETQIDLYDHMMATSVHGSLVMMTARMVLKAKRIIKQTPSLWKAYTSLRSKLFAK